jgi:hypothetical protein
MIEKYDSAESSSEIIARKVRERERVRGDSGFLDDGQQKELGILRKGVQAVGKATLSVASSPAIAVDVVRDKIKGNTKDLDLEAIKRNSDMAIAQCNAVLNNFGISMETRNGTIVVDSTLGRADKEAVASVAKSTRIVRRYEGKLAPSAILRAQNGDVVGLVGDTTSSIFAQEIEVGFAEVEMCS